MIMMIIMIMITVMIIMIMIIMKIMMMMRKRRRICEKAFRPKWSALIGITQYQCNSRPAHNSDFHFFNFLLDKKVESERHFILIYKQQHSNVFALKPAPTNIETIFWKSEVSQLSPPKCCSLPKSRKATFQRPTLAPKWSWQPADIGRLHTFLKHTTYRYTIFFHPRHVHNCCIKCKMYTNSDLKYVQKFQYAQVCISNSCTAHF